MYIVLDIETGGFSKDKNGICEIGALKVDEDGNVIEEFDIMILPYKRKDSDDLVSYKEDAMKIHGITEDDLYTMGWEAKDVIQQFDEFIDGSECFIGHNIKTFDLPWMVSFYERFGCELGITDFVDTLKLARDLRGKGKNSLPALCEEYGITNEEEHRALSDCKATLELWKILKD